MKRITRKQKEKYLQHKGVRCLVCESYNLTPEKPITREDGTYQVTVTCHNCYNRWVDVLTITDVTDYAFRTKTHS